MFLERIKTLVKKHAPKNVYRFLYRIFKYWQVFVLRKDTHVALTDFTTKQFKRLRYDDIAFSLLLDPENGSVDKEIFLHSVWEKDILAIMRTYIKPDSVCIDVGANIGHHTLFMASIAQKGSVHAFEPISRLCDQIEESVAKNNIENIQVHRYGLSDTSGIQEIHLNLLNIGKATFDDRAQGGGTDTVSVKRFDDVWDRSVPVSFIKIDVEGYEYKALQGMEETLRKQHPVILFEYSPVFYKDNGTDRRALLHFVLDVGYRIFDCENAQREITRDTLDVFLQDCTFQTNILCLPYLE